MTEEQGAVEDRGSGDNAPTQCRRAGERSLREQLTISYHALHDDSSDQHVTESDDGIDVIVKFIQLCSKVPPTALLNFACDG